MSRSETGILKSRVDIADRSLVKKLLKSLSEYMTPEMLKEINRAFEFGSKAHQGQKRKSGEAYISHPVAVAEILGNMRMDSPTIIAAILHDVVEDTDFTAEDISKEFGADVAHLVDGVSKVSQLELDSKQNAEAASFRKMFMAMAKDIRVIIIKLCDRLHNMHTLASLDDVRRRRISKQTMEIYAPIANRMGMRELSNKLEDLALENLHPIRYKAIQKMLRSKRRGRKPVVEEARKKIATLLQHNMITAEVVGREKNIFSIYNKALKRRKIALQDLTEVNKKKIELRDIPDINAIRVITENRSQCYAVLGIVHQLYKPRPGSFKDYIAIPKANGYQSIHTSVYGPFGQIVEVQIRSRSMHLTAETGVASHWLYKTDKTGEHAPQQLAQKWLSSFLESQQLSSDSGEFIEHLKADLYPDEVYVFTPKGEIKRLPRGATALDFAYAVHSDVGNRCVGATIDNQSVSLHEKLKNGQYVAITTKFRARPKPEWLNYAVTAKARSAIRHYLHKQKGRQSISLGKKLLKKALWDQGYRKFLIPSSDKLILLSALEMKDWQQLLADIGMGKRLAPLVAKQFIAEINEPRISAKKQPSKNEKNNPGMMTIDGTEGLLVNYSKCCHPIPGDRIIGTTTADRGLVIHRLRCHNAHSIMKHPDQYVHLSWSEKVRSVFEVRLKLDTDNRPGVLSEVSNIIAAHDCNINKLNVDEQAGNLSRMSFVIEVNGRIHLASIMRELRSHSAVIKLERVRSS